MNYPNIVNQAVELNKQQLQPIQKFAGIRRRITF